MSGPEICDLLLTEKEKAAADEIGHVAQFRFRLFQHSADRWRQLSGKVID